MRQRPVGHATRGTTGTNRLRRVDRWLARHPAFLRADDPFVVDLGFGASAVTTLELAERLRRSRADVVVRGVEIDPDRVARARTQLGAVRAGETPFAPDTPVEFERGGFEVPGDRLPAVIRASNVLRQYHETEVAAAWEQLTERLAPGGILVDGTCDELGRVSAWVEVGADGAARSLTISLRLQELESPLVAAERLPKALIHHNVPGERVHDFLTTLDDEWTRAAPTGTFGARQRWIAAMDAVRGRGWRLLSPSRHRLGEVTVPWEAVAP